MTGGRGTREGEGVSRWNGAGGRRGRRKGRTRTRVSRRWMRRATRWDRETGCGPPRRGVRKGHSSSEEKRGLREHIVVSCRTTVPMVVVVVVVAVVEDPDGGGKATHAERSGSVAILRPEYTDTDETVILSRGSLRTTGALAGRSACYATRVSPLLMKYFTLALSRS